MKKNTFHNSKFQKEFYDRLGQEKAEDGGFLSCGYEERYNPSAIISNENTYNLFKGLFSDLLGEGKKGVILDICTGTGIHLPLLSRFSEIVIGADLSSGLLKRAQELKAELQLQNVLLVQSQAESIPLKDDVCDAVIMIDAIHHVENQEQVMEELRRVSRDNALFLLIEPNISNPLVFLAHRIPPEERGALRLNTSRGLSRLLSPYLDAVQVEPFNYVASKKSGFLARGLFRAIEFLFGKIFIFWPIRLLFQGNFSKN